MALPITEKETGGGGTITHEPGVEANPVTVQTRTASDKYTTSTQVLPEEVNLLPLEGKDPQEGKIYTVWFYTDRDIKIPGLPKNISVLGWGIRVESVYKPSPDKINVDIVPLRP